MSDETKEHVCVLVDSGERSSFGGIYMVRFVCAGCGKAVWRLA